MRENYSKVVNFLAFSKLLVSIGVLFLVKVPIFVHVINVAKVFDALIFQLLDYVLDFLFRNLFPWLAQNLANLLDRYLAVFFTIEDLKGSQDLVLYI